MQRHLSRVPRSPLRSFERLTRAWWVAAALGSGPAAAGCGGAAVPVDVGGGSGRTTSGGEGERHRVALPASGGAVVSSDDARNRAGTLCNPDLSSGTGTVFGRPVPTNAADLGTTLRTVVGFAAPGSSFCAESPTDRAPLAAAALAAGFDATTQALFALDADLRGLAGRVDAALGSTSHPGSALRNGILNSLGQTLAGAACEGDDPSAVAAGLAAAVHSPETVAALWWAALMAPLDVSEARLRGPEASFWAGQAGLAAAVAQVVSHVGAPSPAPIFDRSPGDALLITTQVPLACETALRLASDRGVSGAENGWLDSDEAVVLSLTCRNTSTTRLRSESVTLASSSSSCVAASTSEVVVPELAAGASATLTLGPMVVPASCGETAVVTYSLTSSSYTDPGRLVLTLRPRLPELTMAANAELDEPGSSRLAASLRAGGRAELTFSGRIARYLIGEVLAVAPVTESGRMPYEAMEMELPSPFVVASGGTYRADDDLDLGALPVAEALRGALGRCTNIPADLRQNDNWLAVSVALEEGDQAPQLAAVLRSSPELGRAVSALRRARTSLSVRAALNLIQSARARVPCSLRSALLEARRAPAASREAPAPAPAPPPSPALTVCAGAPPSLDQALAALQAALPDLTTQEALDIVSNLLRSDARGLNTLAGLIHPGVPACPSEEERAAAAAAVAAAAAQATESAAAEEAVSTLLLIEDVAALIELSTTVASSIGSTDAALIDALTEAILAPCEGLSWLEAPLPPPYRMTRFVRHGIEP
jgi:hypothetical protein